MIIWERARDGAIGLVEVGGPVVGILLVLSVVMLTVTIWKFCQFLALGVGRYAKIKQALTAVDQLDTVGAGQLMAVSRNKMAHVLVSGLNDNWAKSRLEAAASAHLSQLEKGFRMLDTIAQVAPLLGLFGTVLGMIDAFQALQAAGSAVDPSLLAGGIWVALLTTAAGLAVAMPASLVLSWFESRVARERIVAANAIETIYNPQLSGVSHGA